MKTKEKTKKVYIYDGSYQGLLTALYTAFKLREIPVKILTKNNFRKDLFYQDQKIETNLEKAEFFSGQIKENISAQALNNVFQAYLSEAEKLELYLFRYLFKGFKVGAEIDEYLTKNYVRKVQDLAHKVRHESHRLKGLIRFKEAADCRYYAAIEPDYKVLVLLAPHFEKRFSTIDWIIHDKKREKAVIFSAAEAKWLLIDLKKDFSPDISAKESKVQNLWRSFFAAVTIENRKNLKAQQQFMPKKYWKYLVENPGVKDIFKRK